MNIPLTQWQTHRECTLCELHSNCRRPGLPTRFYTPNPSIRGDSPSPSHSSSKTCVVVLGHQPGVEEDREGIVHCGPSGSVLTTAYLEGSGLPYLAHLYLSNITRCFPLGAKALLKHARACWPYLDSEFKALNPLYPNRYVLLLGKEASSFFFKLTTGEPCGSLKEAQRRNGTSITINGYEWTTFATSHPANLLSHRSPSLIVTVKDHLDFLVRCVTTSPPSPSPPIMVEPGPPP